MEILSYQEKRSLVYLISTLLIIVFYGIYVFSPYLDGTLLPEEINRYWAKAILLMVPAQIVVNIVAYILFAIVNAILTNHQDNHPGIIDERDQIIELRSNRNAYTVLIIGVILSMLPLMFEMNISVMFSLLVSVLFLSQVTWSASQFYYYRRGY